MRIRDLAPADLSSVLRLNNAHAAEVNALGEEALAARVRAAARARVIEDGLGVLIAFDERTPPQGANHAWFLAREPAFVYVDRIVVDAAGRGRGLARALYDDLAGFAGPRPMCCEVNLIPPNPGSLAFHARLGFVEAGEGLDAGSGKRVRYLVRRPAAHG